MFDTCPCSIHVHVRYMSMFDTCPCSIHVHVRYMSMFDTCPCSIHVHVRYMSMFDTCPCFYMSMFYTCPCPCFYMSISIIRDTYNTSMSMYITCPCQCMAMNSWACIIQADHGQLCYGTPCLCTKCLLFVKQGQGVNIVDLITLLTLTP